MDSAAKNKSSCACLLFILLIVHSVVIQVGALRWNWPDISPQHKSLGYGVAVPSGATISGRAMASFIPAEILPPISGVTRVFTTCNDWQTSVSIKVFEGDSDLKEPAIERDCAQYYGDGCVDMEKKIGSDSYSEREWWGCLQSHSICHYLEEAYTYIGDVQLHGILPAPRGLARIEVTFALKDSRLHVNVTDKSTMKSNSTSFFYGYAKIVNDWVNERLLTRGVIKFQEQDPTLFKTAVCLYDVPRLSSSGAQGEHLLVDRNLTGEGAARKAYGIA